MATIHHLNCATMCPHGSKLLGGDGGLLDVHELVCHVLLIETGDGLVLVDTGMGTADAANPKRLGPAFTYLIRPQHRIEETAIERVKALGHSPADVRHIVLTHLDADHAGGLGDFPNAEVHVFKTELEAAENPGLRERPRYIKAQWAHGPRWVPHGTGGDEWKGFDSVRVIEGTDPEVLIVPMAGHTRGHSAIAVKNGHGWLLHCGDAYFDRREIGTPPQTPVGLKVFEAVTEFDRKQRVANVERLRELAAREGGEPHGGSGDVELFSAHDRHELERYQ